MYLAIALVVVVIWLIAVVLMLTYAKIIFCYTETNKNLVRLKGKEFYAAIQGDTNQFGGTEKNTEGKDVPKSLKRIPAWERILLHEPFGIRYVGNPFVYSIGKFDLYYPTEIQSTIEGVHVNGNTLDALDSTHTYRLFLEDTEFATGIIADLYFNLEVVLTRPDVAWGKYGRFLDSLAQGISSRIRQTAMTTDIVQFIGKTSSTTDKETPEAIRTRSKSLRNEMCAECMKLNNDASQESDDLKHANKIIRIDDLSGYSIKVITYQNMEVTDEESRKRIDALELLAESALNVQKSENLLKIAQNEAAGAAATTEQERLAEAKGAEALLAAFGGDKILMAIQINANSFADAIKGNKVATTIFMSPPGSNGNQPAVQPVFPVGGSLTGPPKPAQGQQPTT